MAETTMEWVRSSFCSEGACVEVAPHGDLVAMRDGKDRQGAQLRFTRSEWRGFLAGIRAGHYPS